MNPFHLRHIDGSGSKNRPTRHFDRSGSQNRGAEKSFTFGAPVEFTKAGGVGYGGGARGRERIASRDRAV